MSGRIAHGLIGLFQVRKSLLPEKGHGMAVGKETRCVMPTATGAEPVFLHKFYADTSHSTILMIVPDSFYFFWRTLNVA